MAYMKVKREIELDTHTCWNCRNIYAMDESFYERKRETGEHWWCPYCGKQAVVRVSEKQRLERELKQAESRLAAERARHDQTKASLTAQKAATTRLKNRAKNGVCPCCHRHFTNVERHMKTKHPDFEVKSCA